MAPAARIRPSALFKEQEELVLFRGGVRFVLY